MKKRRKREGKGGEKNEGEKKIKAGEKNASCGIEPRTFHVPGRLML